MKDEKYKMEKINREIVYEICKVLEDEGIFQDYNKNLSPSECQDNCQYGGDLEIQGWFPIEIGKGFNRKTIADTQTHKLLFVDTNNPELDYKEELPFSKIMDNIPYYDLEGMNKVIPDKVKYYSLYIERIVNLLNEKLNLDIVLKDIIIFRGRTSLNLVFKVSH
jgi:hypothetical protein